MRDPSISVEKEMGIGNGQDALPLGFRLRLSSAWGQEGVSLCRIRATVHGEGGTQTFLGSIQPWQETAELAGLVLCSSIVIPK